MADEVYMVKFGNRSAVQKFQAARELLDEKIEDTPWAGLECLKELLDEAWGGLTFTFKDEGNYGRDAEEITDRD